MEDARYMQMALEEARRGVGATSPNPAVGAVLVKDGCVLSRGWHRRAGEPHAEVEALRALGAGFSAKGATLYVTLEPCSSHGRTPPCTDAILAAGIGRVVVGATDPHPLHSGGGVELLRNRGVEVVTGVLEEECRRLNRAFFKWITTGRPWVVAKSALSLDGQIVRPPGEGQWLTGTEARQDAHRLRVESDAVLVGAGTVRSDDPSLTVRDVPMPEGKLQPWRVVVTRSGLLPSGAKIFSDDHRERTLVYQSRPIAEVLAELGSKYFVTAVLAEGGGLLLGELFSEGLVDEVCFYLAPLICGGSKGAVHLGSGIAAAGGWRLEQPEYTQLGRDLRLTGVVARGDIA